MARRSKRLYSVETSRTVFMFAYLQAAGCHALRNGHDRTEGAFYEWMAATVFAAFSVEAYLNHLGVVRFGQHWQYLDRLSVEAKLAMLLRDLNKMPDFTKRPFQTLKVMRKVRDQFAHGRTMSVATSSTKQAHPKQLPDYPEAGWERLCTSKHAERFLDDARSVIIQLHQWAGLDDKLLFSLGEGERAVALVDKAR